jgi:sigma-B regulation protein RsbU (phosphoserine phosphatase)
VQKAQRRAGLADRRRGPERRRNGFISLQGMFEGAAYASLEPLVARCEIRRLAPGEWLLEPGQENHHLFLLLEGALKVHFERSGEDPGFPMTRGECVGEISIIDRQPATAFVTASTAARVLAIPEELLWGGFFAIPGVARNFMRMFAGRFRVRSQVMHLAMERQVRLEYLQKELAIAQDIQARMLPGVVPPGPDLELTAAMVPAQEVGGDFYDAFELDAGRYCVAVGDVSGKGVPAALFMVRTMTLLRTGMLEGRDPLTAIRRLNRVLVRRQCQLHVRHPGPGRGGPGAGASHLHECRSRTSAAQTTPAELRTSAAAPGVLLGVSETARYEALTLDLAPGDALLFYTDGVTGAMDPEGGCSPGRGSWSVWSGPPPIRRPVWYAMCVRRCVTSPGGRRSPTISPCWP